MTIIDELLVLLDDQDKMSLTAIQAKLKHRSKQAISSTLGRLDSKGWIKRTKEKKEMLFRITTDGREEITLNLSRIRELEKSDQWNGSLFFVVFNISEKMRRARDAFRKTLIESGFARAQGDLWVSFWEKRDIISDLAKELNISDHCTVFNTGKLSIDDQKNILKNLVWQEMELNSQYKKFISDASKFQKSKKNGFNARLLVFQYAKILAIDPMFPKQYAPKNYLGLEAFKLYNKVRPYCYK